MLGGACKQVELNNLRSDVDLCQLMAEGLPHEIHPAADQID